MFTTAAQFSRRKHRAAGKKAAKTRVPKAAAKRAAETRARKKPAQSATAPPAAATPQASGAIDKTEELPAPGPVAE